MSIIHKNSIPQESVVNDKLIFFFIFENSIYVQNKIWLYPPIPSSESFYMLSKHGIPTCLFFKIPHQVQWVLLLCAWVCCHSLERGKSTSRRMFSKEWLPLSYKLLIAKLLLHTWWGLEIIYLFMPRFWLAQFCAGLRLISTAAVSFWLW